MQHFINHKHSIKNKEEQECEQSFEVFINQASDYKMNGDSIKERKNYKKPSEGCSFHITVDLRGDLDRTSLGSSWGSFRDDHGSFRRDLDDCCHLAVFGISTGSRSLLRRLGSGGRLRARLRRRVGGDLRHGCGSRVRAGKSWGIQEQRAILGDPSLV